MKKSNRSGFTLFEILTFVGIFVIIAVVAIPRLMAARLATNESAAVSTLRALSSAQAQVRQTAAIDTDDDGIGEYAFFTELAGSASLRIGINSVGESVPLDIPILSKAFRTLNENGQILRSGYLYQMWLPADTLNGSTAIHGIREGSEAVPSSSNSEFLWCCYAWPEAMGKTGNRVFFINQEGEVFLTPNQFSNHTYSGPKNGPEVDAIFIAPDDMSASLSVIDMPLVAQDGNTWYPVK